MGEPAFPHWGTRRGRPVACERRGDQAEAVAPFRRLACDHTPQTFARERLLPRLACQALPDPTTSTWRERSWTAGNKTAAITSGAG